MQVKYPDYPHFVEGEAQDYEIIYARSQKLENDTEGI